jgi:undecaprenyl-diphosphatase
LRFSRRGIVFGALLLAYLLLTLGVVFKSPVLRLDTDLVDLHLRANHPDWKPWIYYYVMFGQRGPASLLFLPYFVWMAWRKRTMQPLVMLGLGLVLLNLSVGVVKLATGRLSPLRTHNAHDVFVGGNIFPSGHVSNTVVLYGLIAWISLRHRKVAVAAAAFLSVSVGLGTVYLDTHWFSDVVGGWIAGALVLLALPTVLPTVERWVDGVIAWLRQRIRVANMLGQPPAPPPRHAFVSRPVPRKAPPVASHSASRSRHVVTSAATASDDPARCG